MGVGGGGRTLEEDGSRRGSYALQGRGKRIKVCFDQKMLERNSLRYLHFVEYAMFMFVGDFVISNG